jgi:hypothetical protein
MAFTTDTWVGSASADWGASSANWSTGFPNSNNNVVISTPAVLTVFYGGGDGLTTVHSLTVGNDVFDMTGGSLVITTSASFSGGFVQTGGVFTGGPVTIKGSGTFNELTFASAEGKTAFTVNAALTIGTYTLGGASVLNNAKTVNQTSQITLGDGTDVNAEINNKKGAVFNIGGDFGIGSGAASAQFINAGTLQRIGGINGSFIDVGFVDTGKIVIATGTLEFRAGTDSFAGAISGNGEFALGGGSKDAINAGTTISAATFAITDGGTVVTLGENLGYAKTFMLQSGALLNINGINRKLTLSGTNFFGNAEIGGTGTLITAAGSSTNVNGFTLGGGVDWQNSGTVGSVGLLQLGDNTFNAATFFNEKGAVYELTNDVGMQTGLALNSSFVNMAGASLEKVGGGGVSTIGVEVIDNGRIVIQTGTMNFTGTADTFGGVISGNGQFEIGGGSSIFGTGAAITTETFTISAATATLGENLSYLSGAFNFVNFSVLSLGGFSLTLSGNDSFNTGTVDGTGTLITDKNSSVSLRPLTPGSGALTLGSAAKWQNSGTVFEFSTLQIGDQSFDKASFINERGGRFILAADTGISVGFNVNSSFVNSAGAVFVKQGGGLTTSAIGAVFVNNGSVVVDIGSIEFRTSVSGKGSFTIEPGTGVQFDASVAAGSTVVFASHTGGDLRLPDSQAFGAAIKGFGGAGTDEIELGDISGVVNLSYKDTSTATVKQGILTVTNGVQTTHLKFLGTYKRANFLASPDPQGGTLIVDPPLHPILLASAH